MATDREATLRIKATLDGMDKAAEQTALFREQVQGAGEQGQATAAELSDVAAAADRLTSAEEHATAQVSEATAAIRAEGEAATVAAAETKAAAAAETDALAGVAGAAKEEAAAITQTGEAATRAGRSTQEGYNAVRAAAEAAIIAWREQTTVAAESGVVSVEATREVVESFLAQAQAIKDSGGATEAQRAALVTIVSALQEITSAAAQAGEAQKEQADLAGGALLNVKAQLANVNAEIRDEIANLREAAATSTESQQTAIEALSVQVEAIRNSNAAYAVQREELSTIQTQLQERLRTALSAGEAEREDAQAAGNALAQVKSALGEVNAGLADEARAWTALRAAQESAVTPTVQQLLAEAESIQKATSNLEVQRATLTSVQTQLRQMLSAEIENGEAGSAASVQIGVALTDVKDKIAEVIAAIKEREAASKQAAETEIAAEEDVILNLNNLRAQTLSISDATQIAATKIRDAWEIYNDELKITPRSIGFIVQAVESVQQAIAANRGTTHEATTAEIEDYERLRVELAKLQAQARLLIDQQRDATILLKEGGNQIQSVGIAVQQLTSGLGPMGQAFGSAAGQAAIFSGGLQQIKDVFKQMNLNQLQFNELNATSITQMGGVAAALILGAAAGLKLAETNKTNAEEISKLKKSFTDFGDTVKDQTDGIQEEVDKSSGSILSFLGNLGNGTAAAAAELAKFADQITTINIANKVGASAVRVYYEAIEHGVASADAERLALSLSRREIELHTEAENKGVIGKELWIAALKASGGNVDEFHRKLTELKATLDQLPDSFATLVKANFGTSGAINANIKAMLDYFPQSDRYSTVLKEQASILQKALDNTTNLTHVERERIQAIIDLASHADTLTERQRALAEQLIAATVAGKGASEGVKQLVADLEREFEATNNSTAAMTRRLTEINALLPASQKHSVLLKTISTEMQEELNKTDGLSEKERERIQVIIELIAKGDALTASEKVLVQYLIQHALAHDRVTVSARAQAEAEGKLMSAVDQLAAAIAEETGKHAENETAIGKAVVAAEALLKANTTLTSSERERLRQMIDLGKQIDADNARLRSYATTTTQAANATNQHAAATENVYSVVRASEKTLQEDIENKKVLFDLLQKLNTKTDESAHSTEALTVSMQNGAKSMSNVKESNVELTGSFKDGSASISNASKETVTFTGNLEEGTAKIVSAGEQVRASTKAVEQNAQGVTTAINGAADAMREHAAKSKAAVDLLVDGTTTLKQSLDGCNETLLGMDEIVVRSSAHMIELAKGIRDVTEASREAAKDFIDTNGADPTRKTIHPAQ